MREGECEKYPCNASYLPDAILQRVMEQAEKEECPIVWLVLWLGLWSGADLRDLLRITAYEAWQGKVAMWDAWGKLWKSEYICERPERLEKLRAVISKQEIINIDGLMFEWITKKEIDAMICDVCVRAGVRRKIQGYSSVVRGEKARHDKLRRDIEREREKERRAREAMRKRKRDSINKRKREEKKRDGNESEK